MKLVRTLSMIIALAGAATAFADTPPAKAPAEKKAPEPKKEEISAADAAKAEKFWGDFVDAFVKNQDSCPKMAAAVNAVITANEAFLMKMAESGKEPPASLKEKMQKRQGEMMSAAMKCKDDKDLAAALQRFAAMDAKRKAGASKPADKTPPPPAKKN
jgi:hypothetical protein